MARLERVVRVPLTDFERHYLGRHWPTLRAAQDVAAMSNPEYVPARDGPLLREHHLHVGRLAWRATVERLLLGGIREERLPDGATRIVREADAPSLTRLAGAVVDAALAEGWGGADA